MIFPRTACWREALLRGALRYVLLQGSGEYEGDRTPRDLGPYPLFFYALLCPLWCYSPARRPVSVLATKRVGLGGSLGSVPRGG